MPLCLAAGVIVLGPLGLWQTPSSEQVAGTEPMCSHSRPPAACRPPGSQHCSGPPGCVCDELQLPVSSVPGCLSARDLPRDTGACLPPVVSVSSCWATAPVYQSGMETSTVGDLNYGGGATGAAYAELHQPRCTKAACLPRAVGLELIMRVTLWCWALAWLLSLCSYWGREHSTRWPLTTMLANLDHK